MNSAKKAILESKTKRMSYRIVENCQAGKQSHTSFSLTRRSLLVLLFHISRFSQFQNHPQRFSPQTFVRSAMRTLRVCGYIAYARGPHLHVHVHNNLTGVVCESFLREILILYRNTNVFSLKRLYPEKYSRHQKKTSRFTKRNGQSCCRKREANGY